MLGGMLAQGCCLPGRERSFLRENFLKKPVETYLYQKSEDRKRNGSLALSTVLLRVSFVGSVSVLFVVGVTNIERVAQTNIFQEQGQNESNIQDSIKRSIRKNRSK